MKKVFAIIFLILVFIIFTYGYSRNNLNDRFNITENDYKQYINSINSGKDLINDGINVLNDNWADFIESLQDFGDISFDWRNDLTFGGNILHILTSIFNILKYPIKLIINVSLFVYNNFALFIYYIIAFIQWSLGIGGAL